VTIEELERARANLRADRLHRDETVDGQARSLGYGLRTSHKLLYDEVYTTLVNSLQPSLIAGAMRRWLDPSKAVIVALLPNEETAITEADLSQAFISGVEDVFGRDGKTPQYLGAGEPVVNPKAGAVIFDLSPGVKLV